MIPEVFVCEDKYLPSPFSITGVKQFNLLTSKRGFTLFYSELFDIFRAYEAKNGCNVKEVAGDDGLCDGDFSEELAGLFSAQRKDILIKFLQVVDKDITDITLNTFDDAIYRAVFGATWDHRLICRRDSLYRLALAAACLVNHRILLLNQIENWLSASYFEGFWKLVVETALELNAQVFMGSDSQEMLEVFANTNWSLTNYPVAAFFLQRVRRTVRITNREFVPLGDGKFSCLMK